MLLEQWVTIRIKKYQIAIISEWFVEHYIGTLYKVIVLPFMIRQYDEKIHFIITSKGREENYAEEDFTGFPWGLFFIVGV